MKNFLIGFAVWFFLGFGLQLIKSWFFETVRQWKKKRASRDDQWMYRFW